MCVNDYAFTAKPSRPGSSCSIQGHLLVPSERYGRRQSAVTRLTAEVMSEEQVEAIKKYGALSTAVHGNMKSFSTGDLLSLDQYAYNGNGIRKSASEIALIGGIVWNSKLEAPHARRLDAASRSCSTWVAVGDLISCTSQLPSPQAPAESIMGSNSAITPLDFVLSVNKKVRQMYIRRRLMSTYRALERLSRSQLNVATDGIKDKENIDSAKVQFANYSQVASTDFNVGDTMLLVKSASSCKLFEALEKLRQDIATLTVRDIELQKGKPLTKYERNMMIFDWLQEVDQTETPEPLVEPTAT